MPRNGVHGERLHGQVYTPEVANDMLPASSKLKRAARQVNERYRKEEETRDRVIRNTPHHVLEGHYENGKLVMPTPGLTRDGILVYHKTTKGFHPYLAAKKQHTIQVHGDIFADSMLAKILQLPADGKREQIPSKTVQDDRLSAALKGPGGLQAVVELYRNEYHSRSTQTRAVEHQIRQLEPRVRRETQAVDALRLASSGNILSTLRQDPRQEAYEALQQLEFEEEQQQRQEAEEKESTDEEASEPFGDDDGDDSSEYSEGWTTVTGRKRHGGGNRLTRRFAPSFWGLNGANGEWTNTDDMPRQKKAKRAPQRRSRPRARRPAPRRRPMARRRPQRTRGSQVRLSACAAKYAVACSTPWAPAAAGACVPSFPAVPTMKFSCRLPTVQIVVGTQGIGGAWICGSLVTDRPCIMSTTALYNHTTLVAANNSDGVSGFWTQTFPTGMAIAAQADGSISARCVALGGRLTYTGTTLNEGGLAQVYMDPTHESLEYQGYDTGSLGSYATTITKPVRGNLTMEFSTAAVRPQEFTMQKVDSYLGYGLAGFSVTEYVGATGWSSLEPTGCAFGMIIVTGTPGNTFNLDYTQLVEYEGDLVGHAVTPTHTDARGFEMVQEAVQRLPLERAARSGNDRNGTSSGMMWDLLRDVAAEVMPAVATSARQFIRGQVRSIMA